MRIGLGCRTKLTSTAEAFLSMVSELSRAWVMERQGERKPGSASSTN